MVVVEAQRLLRASREHVFAYVAHPEHLPRYGAPLWLTADADSRRGGPGETLLMLRGYFAGLPVEAVVRTTSRTPQTLEITQVRGTLRAFSQRFTIEAGDEGTVLLCRVEADPGIPMLSDEAAKHFLVQYVERMLDRLRLAAERRAPSRRLARPARPGADAAAADADDTTQIDVPVDEPAGEARQNAGEELGQPGGGAEAIAPPGIAESQAPTTPRAPRVGRRDFRPRPPGRPRPPVPIPSASAAASPVEQAGEAGQSRRRRRRRRRRGRGTPGSGAAGGATGTGSPPPG